MSLGAGWPAWTLLCPLMIVTITLSDVLNNTLILGPGGYAFGDYRHMGLPLEIIVVAVATPMILLVWHL